MTEAFPLIEAAGPPFERGVAIGRQTGDRIARSIAIYGRLLERRSLAWSDVRLLAGRYLPRLVAFDAAVVEEIRGVAAGSERPVEDIVALNARTELLYDRNGDAEPHADGCTGAIALPEATADGHLIHGQNWDWFDACKDSAVVMRLEQEDGLRLLIFDGPYGPAFRRGGAPGGQAKDVGAVDTRDGGNAISYMDEDPQIRKTYEAELAANGMKSHMPEWAYETRTPPEGALAPAAGF